MVFYRIFLKYSSGKLTKFKSLQKAFAHFCLPGEKAQKSFKSIKLLSSRARDQQLFDMMEVPMETVENHSLLLNFKDLN